MRDGAHYPRATGTDTVLQFSFKNPPLDIYKTYYLFKRGRKGMGGGIERAVTVRHMGYGVTFGGIRVSR